MHQVHIIWEYIALSYTLKRDLIMNKTMLKMAVLPVAALSCSSLSAEQKQPNIVFIMADDLGWNDLSVMNSDFYETPNIDKLSTEGMLFTNAYAAAANSAPSRACLMSGRYTPRHGVFTVSPSARGKKSKRKLIPIKNTEDLRSDFVTMAEALSNAGYRCGHVGKWHLGDDEDGTGPLSQGFDVNVIGSRAGSPYSYFYPYCNEKKGKCHKGLEKGKKGEYLTDRLTTEAINFINGSTKEQPFFLYMAHHAVHVPLRAPASLIEKYKNKAKGKYQKNAIYAAMIENLDHNVGRLCTTLDSLGITDNTIVVFYSDNGGSEPVTDNFMIRGGKGTPYEGGIRVPLIVKWPGKVKAGSRTDFPITGVDFYPTLLSIANGKVDVPLDGVDVSSVFLGKKKEINRDLFWHFPAYLQSYKHSGKDFRATPYSIIRSGDWKLIYYYETKSSELFNLKDDLMEAHDLSNKYPHKKKELEGKLMKWLDETKAPIPTELNPYYKGIASHME